MNKFNEAQKQLLITLGEHLIHLSTTNDYKSPTIPIDLNNELEKIIKEYNCDLHDKAVVISEIRKFSYQTTLFLG